MEQPDRDDAPPHAAPGVDLVIIGSSTGGPDALIEVLDRLPAFFDTPIVVCQHLPAGSTRMLAERLDRSCQIEVREAVDGEVIGPRIVLVAPGDHHITMRATPLGVTVALDRDPPVDFCRPSVDRLFRSAAAVCGTKVLAVVLTGMGRDGRDGSALVKQFGGTVIVQDEATSVAWGMPGAVMRSGLADAVVPITELAAAIVRHTSSRSEGEVRQAGQAG